MIDEIQKMEDLQVPKGRIDLIGCGRLGLRIAINLIQIHRGGPKVIGAFDGQKISDGDIIFKLYGAELDESKPDFIKRLCTHDKEFRKIEVHNEYINDDNLDLITGDVIIIVIAGGNTIPTASKIIKHAQKKGAKTISTAGIFGFGNEHIEIKDISEYEKRERILSAFCLTVLKFIKFIAHIRTVISRRIEPVASKMNFRFSFLIITGLQ